MSTALTSEVEDLSAPQAALSEATAADSLMTQSESVDRVGDDPAPDFGSLTMNDVRHDIYGPAAGWPRLDPEGLGKAFVVFPFEIYKSVGAKGEAVADFEKGTTSRVPASLLPKGVTYAKPYSERFSDREADETNELLSDWKPSILVAPGDKCTFEGSVRLRIQSGRDGDVWRVEPHWKLIDVKDDVSDDEVAGLAEQLYHDCNWPFDDTVKSQRMHYLGSMMEGDYKEALRAWQMSIPTWLCHDAEKWGGHTEWHVNNYHELLVQKMRAERDWSASTGGPVLPTEQLDERWMMDEVESPTPEVATAKRFSRLPVREVVIPAGTNPPQENSDALALLTGTTVRSERVTRPTPPPSVSPDNY